MVPPLTQRGLMRRARQLLDDIGHPPLSNRIFSRLSARSADLLKRTSAAPLVTKADTGGRCSLPILVMHVAEPTGSQSYPLTNWKAPATLRPLICQLGVNSMTSHSTSTRTPKKNGNWR